MSNSAKIVLWLFLISAVVTSGLWIVGGKRHESSTELEIDSDPQVIFSYLTQPNLMKGWMTGLLDVQPLTSKELESDSVYPRTTSRTMEVGGRPAQFVDRVLRFEPDESISVQSSNSNLVVTTIFQLKPINGHTLLTYRVQTQPQGFGRILAPIQAYDFQAQIDADIRQLKSILEKEEKVE